MDEDYERTLPDAARLRLFIADCFTIDIHPPVARLEIETAPMLENGKRTLWIIAMLDGHLTKFLHRDIGYWVRQAKLYTDEQQAYIECQVGYSPETGRLIKLLPRNRGSKPSVWMESEPVAHVLLTQPVEQLSL